jgi:hydroxymethylbilane synthase
LRRLGLEEHVTEVLSTEVSLPAAGQGALAIEAFRESRGWAAAAPLDDADTSACVRAERAVLAKLVGSCTVPLAAYAVRDRGAIHLRAMLGGPDGKNGVRVVRVEARGKHPEELGATVAAKLLDAGAGPLLEAARTQAAGLPAPRR